MESVATVTEILLRNLKTKETETCRIKEGTPDKFFAIEMPAIPKKRKSPRQVKKAQKVKTEKPIGKSGSKYKGVKREGTKFSGSYWDGVKKKAKYLGMFDSELLAAAAVEKALGNKKEAKRLLNEYQEGDPLVTARENIAHSNIFGPSEE